MESSSDEIKEKLFYMEKHSMDLNTINAVSNSNNNNRNRKTKNNLTKIKIKSPNVWSSSDE